MSSLNIQPVKKIPTLFTCARPGYPSQAVPLEELQRAVTLLQRRKIKHIFCLLTDGEYFKYYGLDLLTFYRHNKFRVHRFPIPDFNAPNVQMAYAAVRRLDSLLRKKERIVIHCSAGKGRTGLLINCLQQWIAHRDSRQFEPADIEASTQFWFINDFRQYLQQKH